MNSDNGKITTIYWFYARVMIKTILYERTVGLGMCASMDTGAVIFFVLCFLLASHFTLVSCALSK